MKLPKVPDFLKIPELSELSYSSRELDALDIDSLTHSLYYRSVTGYGNLKTMKVNFNRMIETPLSKESFKYRHEFFNDLMQSQDHKKNMEKLVKNLPRSNAIVKDEFRQEYSLDYLETQRLLEFPDTISSINDLLGDIKLANDFKKMTNNFYKNNNDFVKLSAEILKNHPINSWETVSRTDYKNRTRNYRTKEKLHENHDYVLEKIMPYKEISNFGKEVRNQFLIYLMFGKALEKGVSPDIVFGNAGIGNLEKAIHPRYNSNSSEDKKVSRFGSAVPNDIFWSKDSRQTLITGSNSGGKSVYLKTIGLNVLLAMNGFHPLADKVQLIAIRRIWPAFDFGDEKDAGHLETGLKYFRNLAENVTTKDLLLMDEPAQGAEPAAEYELAKGNISKIAYLGGFNSFVVTHDIDMMKEFDGKKGVVFKRVADYDDEENKYKIMDGLATGGYGMRLAKKIGADPESLEKLILKRKKNGEL